MNARYFALVFGFIYALVGLAGLVFPGMTVHHDIPPADLAFSGGFGYLFGLFPVNVLHNLVHLGLGVWGVIAGNTTRYAVQYARALAIIFAVLTLMGLIPALNVTFGLIPLYGHDVWLHALTAMIAAYFGFIRAPSISHS